MSYLFQVLPIFLPVLFWGYYHYHKDRHLPEPIGHLVLTFILGMLAAAVSPRTRSISVPGGLSRK